jgi:probable F420-dependent oxidoreductase
VKLGLLLVEEDISTFAALGEAADRGGLDSAWTVEYYNRNSLVRLALLATRTRTLTIGSAVTAAFARAPLMIATAVADISALAPGRVVLGLGSSTRRMNEDWYGAVVDHPAPRLEELVMLLRQLLSHSSGPFEFEGRFSKLRFAHLDKIPVEPPPIYTAGVNPRMVEAAGRIADGFVGHPIATRKYLAEVALPAIRMGAQRAGRPEKSVRRLTQVITAIDEDEAAARRRAALQVAFYSTTRTYEVIFATHGFEEEPPRIRRAFLEGDHEGMVRATSDRMLAEMAVFGRPGRVLEELERYADVADEVILYPPHFGLTPAESRQGHLAIIEAVGAARRTHA